MCKEVGNTLRIILNKAQEPFERFHPTRIFSCKEFENMSGLWQYCGSWQDMCIQATNASQLVDALETLVTQVDLL
jgi:hypothetical protein